MDLFWYIVIVAVFFIGVCGEWIGLFFLNPVIYHEAWKEAGSPDWGHEAFWGAILGPFAFFYFWLVMWILYFH
jgi:hypothetical protein